ncbi:MAG: amino acid permease [Proteobacteria bacterium]|jgi:APA family basic amino acid/polyamine antiporter|nr:amino acid permease [Pseudomonadota bacterium]
MSAIPRTPQLLGPWAAAAVVAGSILGVGIFIGPPQMATVLDSEIAFVALWVLGGAIALCGALSLAELGAALPRSGGDYPYLAQLYPAGVGFAAGWLEITAVFPGSLATISVALATYQLPVLLGPVYDISFDIGGHTVPANVIWAAALIGVLACCNQLGLRVSGRLQIAVVSLPIAVLAAGGALVLFGALPAPPPAAATAAPSNPAAFALAAAFLPVYFAFSGWYGALYVGAEVERPARTLPRALVGGTLAVLLLYLLLDAVFLRVLGLGGLAEVGEAGTAAAQRVLGERGSFAMALLIAVAVLGTLNGTMLSGSRIAQAMAARGDFPRFAAKSNRRTGTPSAALWIQTGWTLALVAVGEAKTLLDYTVGAMLLSGILMVLAVILLRRRSPELARPFRVPLYPLPPIFFVAANTAVLVILAVKGTMSVAAPFAWFALALLAHRIFRRKRAQ